ncbi:HSP-12.2 protein [Aphelenchoides avenae]|nr:HSP-12.2 protein [Aphelenchus avenae]
MSKIEVTTDHKSELDWPLQHNDGQVEVIDTPEKWEINLEAGFFLPKEVDVKVMGDKLAVHCRHEMRTHQHGDVSREINRTYTLPSDVDPATLKSHLNSKGILQITAAKKK